MMWTACTYIRVDMLMCIHVSILRAGFASSISAFGLEEPTFYDMYLQTTIYTFIQFKSNSIIAELSLIYKLSNRRIDISVALIHAQKECES